MFAGVESDVPEVEGIEGNLLLESAVEVFDHAVEHLVVGAPGDEPHALHGFDDSRGVSCQSRLQEVDDALANGRRKRSRRRSEVEEQH